MSGNATQRTNQILWLGLLGLVVLFFFALIFQAIPMEQKISQAVKQVVHQAGYRRINVDIRGRDVTLVGAVASEQGANRSMTLAANVDGVRVVYDELRIIPVRLPHLRLDMKANGMLSVVGELPHPVHLDQLLDQLLQAGYETPDFRVEIFAGAAEPQWLDQITQFLEIVKPLKNLRLEIGAGSVSIGGIMQEPAAYEGLISVIEETTAAAGLDWRNRIATLPPSG